MSLVVMVLSTASRAASQPGLPVPVAVAIAVAAADELAETRFRISSVAGEKEGRLKREAEVGVRAGCDTAGAFVAVGVFVAVVMVALELVFVLGKLMGVDDDALCA